MPVKTNIAVLVSGGGTNLQALIDAEKEGRMPHGRITMVVSDREGAYALTRAQEAGIPAVLCRKKGVSQQLFEEQLNAVLKEQKAELIVLAGFLSILSESFTSCWKQRIINVHPSLIPSFCGKGMYGLKVHEAALAKGVRVTGATVHYVNEIPDGGEIILQKAVEVRPGDTPEVLQKRVMEEAEWILLPRAAEMICRKLYEEKKMDVYHVDSLNELLRNNVYPGRGIVIGTSECGKYNIVAYFIMGRSVNSRNRVFVKEPDGIRTEAFDPSLVSDPSLIIYHPARTCGDRFIITNGDQTDTIRDYLLEGKDFAEALRTREFEPDGPNYTPRISGIVDADGTYSLSILKSIDPEGSACQRQTFEYPVKAGLGHFLHTYVTDGNPIPSFAGEPERVTMSGDIDTFTENVWKNLNEDNKISLYVRFCSLETGEAEERIINKHVKED